MNGVTEFSRRSALKAAGSSLIVAGIGASGVVIGSNGAWSATARALKPETFATLVQMSRDIYIHPRLDDKVYADAVHGLDVAANEDAALLQLMEDGAADLDKSAIADKAESYAKQPDEDKRLALLVKIEQSPFFQKIRSNLVTGIYNNKAVWPMFGYEGASADKGGYIDRGFNDVDWL